MFGLDQGTLLWIMSFVIFCMFLLGMPIFLCVAYWSLCASLITGFTIENIGITCYQGISSYALLAMPLFILTGDLIGEGGVAAKMADLSRLMLCRIRGGMAMAVQLCCAIFSAVSGSNSATVATIGRIMIPEMDRQGYNKDFSAATAAAGGITGIMIPPSILMIVYGYAANTSVLDLFMAGWVPGITMTLALMAGAYYWSSKYKWGFMAPFDSKATLRALVASHYGIWAIVLILVIVYNGIASSTEAAGVIAAYCLLVGVFATRGIKLKNIPGVFLASGRVCGMLAPIIAVSIVLQQNFAVIGVQTMLSTFLTGLGSKWVTMGAIMLLITGMSMIMESISLTIVLAPVVAPIAFSLGFDPTHFGIIFITGLCIGFIMPPFGLDLFVASGITGIPYARLIRWLPPYLIANWINWILIALIPWLSLCLVTKPF